jgi:hypothetical protein
VDTYYRVNARDSDPAEMLDPDNQKTTPWGHSAHGEQCDKCAGEGETSFECESCKATGRSTDCAHCGGELRYRDSCPTCNGTGVIDESPRDGVSVFPDPDGLYRYMLKRDADLDSGCVLVTLEGEPSRERDFDADEGAVLVRPKRIVETGPVDEARVAELREELERSPEEDPRAA